MPVLAEFKEIVEGEWKGAPPGARPPRAEDLRLALNALWTHQFIFATSPRLGNVYETLRTYSAFVADFFGCLGYGFKMNPRLQMVGLIVPQGDARYEAMYEKLSKDDTVLLLGLRLMFEEAIANQDMSDLGVCETTTDDIVDRIKTVTLREPPDEPRLMKSLRFFHRHNVVRIGLRDRQERVTPIMILPSVPDVVPETYVDELRLWIQSGASDVANQNDIFAE